MKKYPKFPEIVPQETACKIDAVETLERAKAMALDTVIIHGFKNGKVYTLASDRQDAMTLLGSLEAAKRAIWQ